MNKGGGGEIHHKAGEQYHDWKYERDGNKYNQKIKAITNNCLLKERWEDYSEKSIFAETACFT